MDCLSTTSDVEEIVVMAAAQVGKTETILNAVGYIIDHAPGPVILVQPTVELAKRFSRQRVDPLVTGTPRLLEKVAAAKTRDSSNTMLSKEFTGGQLIITGANSAVGLRSMPAQYAFLDEIDGYPVDVDEEGSPVALVEARQRTFARRKRAKVSTPTIAGRSAIEEAYHDTDQRRFYVPCPDCGHMQPLEFGQLQWTKYKRTPEQAVYECRACFYLIEQHHKTSLLARGAWVAERPEQAGKIRGYHLNALYAPAGWISWGDIAAQFVKVHTNPEKFRVFVNTASTCRKTVSFTRSSAGAAASAPGPSTTPSCRVTRRISIAGRGASSTSCSSGAIRTPRASRCRSGCSRSTAGTTRRRSTTGRVAIR
jgi:phage terminase large subunit GpA-like protein